MPDEKNNIVTFKNFKNKILKPFVIYGDLETILKPVNSCKNDSDKPFTQDTHLHEEYSFAYFIKCSFDSKYNKFVTYRGIDAMKVFIERLNEDLKPIYEILSNVIPMIPLTDIENVQYDIADTCHICEKNIFTTNSKKNYKVHDHCHLTGKFIGAAHNKCNIGYKIDKTIPFVFHNLGNYDMHLMIRGLSKWFGNIDILPINKEKYISLTKHVYIGEKKSIKIRFIDSLRFMSYSLKKLVSNLDKTQLCITNEFFNNYSDMQKELINRKGVFPYEYVDSYKKLLETQLPSQTSFFNSMTNEHISDEDYLHAHKVWNTFECKTIGEYSDLYLKLDVLLLCDVFENFRSICMNLYKLDPAHYFTAPGLSWDAMLKYTRIELELLTDIDKHQFIKNSIRGGLVQCNNHYATANNKYMNNYDESKPSEYLIYLDANNLYGWAMSQPLPYKNFQWLSTDEISHFKLDGITNASKEGFILEVDLEYPDYLHNNHSDLPFCISAEIPPNGKNTKLLATVYNKKKYVIHYINLQQALHAGLILTKIHRILKFDQKAWMKPFIDLNNQMRTVAKNDFETDFYKLMNNCCFGKCIENVDKRSDIKLVTKWSYKYGKKICARNLISKPNFKSGTVFDENLVAIQMNKVKVTYNKPIYIGFCVLDLSKTLMYDFHYNYMKKKYNVRIYLNYTDTDSFIYSIFTEDFYEDILNDLNEYFDTSPYGKNNLINLPLVNKKVLGKFKDECGDNIMIEFIGIKSKSYCIDKLYNDPENKKTVKKIKGIKKTVVDNEISIADFKKCVFDKESKTFRSMLTFRSKKHYIYTQLINKLALSNVDDKRYQIEDSFKTLPWGHKDIPPPPPSI